MSDQGQGPGWWVASDGKWYPPHLHPQFVAPAPPAELPAPMHRQPERRKWIIGAAVLGSLVAVVVLLAALGAGDDDEPEDKTAVTVREQEPEPERTTTTRGARDPVPSDFSLAVIVTEQKCFGSAGCSVAYTVELSRTTSDRIADRGWTLIYEVTGGEDGAQINTIRLVGDGQYQHEGETRISTGAADTPLAATITAVRED